MHRSDLLLRTKLSPPQRQRRVLARPALWARLPVQFLFGWITWRGTR